jgi:hypothetical protein
MNQCFGSGFNWVSGSGSKKTEIVPQKRKSEEVSRMNSLNVLVGFKKTYDIF